MYHRQEDIYKEIESVSLLFERTSFKRLNKVLAEITESEDVALSFLLDIGIDDRVIKIVLMFSPDELFTAMVTFILHA